MALFVITGTGIALDAGAEALPAAIIGVISGVGGGIIRDMLAGEIPTVLKGGYLYATAAFAGAALFVLMDALSLPEAIAATVPVLLIFGLRFGSLRYGWGVPKVHLAEG
jgi:uncharacterized membrane protein YeiH